MLVLPLWSTSIPTPEWRRTPSPTGSSRTRSRPRIAGRRRSCRSTTREPVRHRRPSVRCGPVCRNGAPPPTATVPSTMACHSRSPVTPTTLAELPATIEAGVTTSKAFMVFDPAARSRRCSTRCGSWPDAAACCRSTARIHAARPCGRSGAAAGDTPATSPCCLRPPCVEAVATARALAFARATDSPVHVVHLSSAAALDEVRRARAAGVRVSAETCPHYLVLTEECYEDPDPVRCACYVISPPIRSAADRDALWAGLADGSLDLVATDHVPAASASRRPKPGRVCRSTESRAGLPASRHCCPSSTARASPKAGSATRADGRPAVDHARRAVRSPRAMHSRSAATPTSW